MQGKTEPGLWGPDGILAVPHVKMVLALVCVLEVRDTMQYTVRYTKANPYKFVTLTTVDGPRLRYNGVCLFSLPKVGHSHEWLWAVQNRGTKS